MARRDGFHHKQGNGHDRPKPPVVSNPTETSKINAVYTAETDPTYGHPSKPAAKVEVDPATTIIGGGQANVG